MAAEYDVFVSHAWADGGVPLEIASTLKEAGLKVWFDATEIADFESITRAVTQGLVKSKAFVAYYSKTYPLRRACQWELTVAILAAQRDGDPRRRVLVVNPEQGIDHIHPIELRDAKAPRAPATGDGIALRALAETIRTRVAGLSGALQDVRPLTSPIWHGMRGVGSTRFVGRLQELWHIHSLLNAADVAQVTGAPATGGIAKVSGLGGIGKSLVAEEYAIRFGAAYPGGIFWLRAYGHDASMAGMKSEDREAERNRQVQNFAARLGVNTLGLKPPEVERALVDEIARRGEPFLWVVDDVPIGLDGQALRQWFAPHPLGRTLLTTRSREYSAQAAGLELSLLPPEDAYQLLTSHRVPANDTECEQAHLLAADLGYHALALDVTGAALASFGLADSFHEFREQLVRRDEDALKLAEELTDSLPNGHEPGIAQTLLRSIRALGPEGSDFLRLASVMAVAPISASLVTGVFEQADKLTHQDSVWRQAKAFRQVTSTSLAEVAGEHGDARSVHTLVARAMRFRDAERDRTTALRTALVDVLKAQIGEAATDLRLHGGIEFQVVHAREVISTLTAVSEADLVSLVGQYDYERGAYPASAALFSRALEFRRGVQGSDNPDTLAAMTNLARVLRAAEDWDGAGKLDEEALVGRRTLYGDEHPDTLTSMNNLAETLRMNGQRIEAFKLAFTTLGARRRVLGDEASDTLTSMNDCAETLHALGDLATSQKIHEEALSLRIRVLGREDPDTLISMNNLAEVLREQGHLARARELHEEVLATRRRIRGPQHPETLTSLNNLALTLRIQGELAEARKLQEEALTLHLRLFGNEHGNTVVVAWNMFQLLKELGEHAAARAIFEANLQWLFLSDPTSLKLPLLRLRKRLEESSSSLPE